MLDGLQAAYKQQRDPAKRLASAHCLESVFDHAAAWEADVARGRVLDASQAMNAYIWGWYGALAWVAGRYTGGTSKGSGDDGPPEAA